MNEVELQKLLDAQTPILFKFGFGQTLLLDSDGFSIKRLWNKRYPWHDVSGFKVKHVSGWGGRRSYIFFNQINASPLAVIHRLFSGYHAAITTLLENRDNFDNLAQLLNHWREKALQKH